jgi:hypothetical protein
MWRCTACGTENREAVFFCSRCACHRAMEVPAEPRVQDPLRLSSPPVLGKEFCLWLPPINRDTGLIVIQTSQRGILGLLTYTCLPLVIGLLLLILARPEVRAVARPVGLLFILVAGLPGGFLLRMALKGQIGIVLDRNGIWINTSRMSSGYLLWTDLSRGELVIRRGSSYIGLDVRDRSKFRVSLFNLLFNRYPFVITDWAVGDALTGLWVCIRRILENPALPSELGVFEFRRGTLPR